MKKEKQGNRIVRGTDHVQDNVYRYLSLSSPQIDWPKCGLPSPKHCYPNAPAQAIPAHIPKAQY